MIRGGLRTILLGEATVTAIVGATGVHVGRAPQGTGIPRCEIQLADEDENLTLEGKLSDANEVFSTHIDIDCKAPTEARAATLARAVAAFLRDFTGAAGDQTIEAVNLNDKGTSIENPIDASDQARHAMTLEFTIHWRP